MNRPLTAFAGAVAAVATGIAVWAGTNVALALPAATVAVAAAALLFVESVPSVTRREHPPVPPRSSGGVDRIRTAFRTGRVGRELIVSLLDNYERTGPNPAFAGRRPEEQARLARLPGSEFREYVRGRIDELEARS